MAEKLKHLITASQLLDEELLGSLFAAARGYEREDSQREYSLPLPGRLLACIFYEPSTRTRFSFEAAMQKLGGGVLTSENASENSSAAKGETIADTVRVLAGYADGIVLRHTEEGAARAAAAISPVPVINAGDGAGEHPTQALIDLYTIEQELGRREDLHVVLVGDLRNGRTVHSLLPVLIWCRDIRLDLISPPELRLPESYRAQLAASGVRFREGEELAPSLAGADVVYLTRVQRERFASPAEYESIKHRYQMDLKMAAELKPQSIIMHALPRMAEISPEVDADARAAYFRQARNGLYVRMALLRYLLS